jgi:hypothetical protein
MDVKWTAISVEKSRTKGESALIWRIASLLGLRGNLIHIIAQRRLFSRRIERVSLKPGIELD